jgi:acetolactate synthase regulatory subunit
LANILLDSDRCNYTCSACGAVQSRTNRKANNRERACAADEDRTTRGDAYVVAPSRFDIAFKSVSESRRHFAITTVESSFVSQKAKKRFRLGYAHESTTRAAVLASEARSRMSQKQHSKNAQLIISLERLFDQLEPIDVKLKRHLRVEIDRAFRVSVLHCSACHEGCTLKLETRTNSSVAIALIIVSLQRLLDGRENLDALSQAHILAVRDRIARCDSSVQSAARAVQVALHTLLDSRSEAVALPPCMCDAIEAPSPHLSLTVKPHEQPSDAIGHLQAHEGGSPSMKRARKASCPPATMTGGWQQSIANPDADSPSIPIIGNPSFSSTAISSLSNTSLASAESAASTVQMAKSKTLSLAHSPAPSPNPIPQLSVKRLQASLQKIWALMPSSPQTQATANRLVTETLFAQTMSKAVHVHGIKSTVLLAIFIDTLGSRLGRVGEAPEEVKRLATSKVKSVVLNEMEAFLPSKAETTAEFF